MNQWLKKQQEAIRHFANRHKFLGGLGMGGLCLIGFYLYYAPFFTSPFAIYGGALFFFVAGFCGFFLPSKEKTTEKHSPSFQKNMKKYEEIKQIQRNLFWLNSKNSQSSPYALDTRVSHPIFFRQSDYPEMPFEKENKIIPAANIEQRLKAINFNMDDLPEEFFDPITFEIMNNPMITYTRLTRKDGSEQKTPHIYDATTLLSLKGICPENRQPFCEIKVNTELKKKMLDFVKTQEDKKCGTKSHHARTVTTTNKKKVALR